MIDVKCVLKTQPFKFIILFTVVLDGVQFVLSTVEQCQSSYQVGTYGPVPTVTVTQFRSCFMFNFYFDNKIQMLLPLTQTKAQG